MSRNLKASELLLPTGLLLCLFVVIAPLPPAVLDVLLMANIALSVIILLTTVHVATPFEFSVFPTVLLATTLARLVLNVATTRLILTKASERGLDAAGGVIRSFGEFVAGDQVFVGLVLFAIIAVIQFVVITKGATRISEVSARFALDGLPGKQLAIDADLNSGAIDEAEAQRRRADITRQADFYGAMDGASKFVRGDAVASVFITMMNVVGGLTIGILQYGMSPVEAASVFTKLTIGDGLVSQLPALLISLAAGLLVTRSTQRTNLPVEFLQQLIARPQVLVISGVFLALLVVTQLPTVPLLMLGGTCVGAALLTARRTEPSAAVLESKPAKRKPSDKSSEKRIEEYLAVDPVELELGLQLVRHADSKRGGNLLARITKLRQAVASEMGLVLPRVRIRDNLRLNEYEYRIKIQGNAVTKVVLPAGFFCVNSPHGEDMTSYGTPMRHPAFRMPLTHLDRDKIQEVQQSGLTVLDATGIIVHHLRRVVSHYAAELLTRDATKLLIEETRRVSPAVVDELIPNLMKLSDVQRILQLLLNENVSVRQLNQILEALGDYAGDSLSVVELTERVRHRLSRSICAQYRDDRDRLYVVTLDPALEEHVLRSTQVNRHDLRLSLTTQETDELCRSIDAGLQELRRQGRSEIILVRPEIRAAVKRLTASSLSELVVLSYAEMTAETKVVSLGIVSQEDM